MVELAGTEGNLVVTTWWSLGASSAPVVITSCTVVSWSSVGTSAAALTGKTYAASMSWGTWSARFTWRTWSAGWASSASAKLESIGN